MLLATIFVIGFCSSTFCEGFTAPFQCATVRRVHLHQLRNHNENELDERITTADKEESKDESTQTERNTTADKEESSNDESNFVTWAELQADPELREAGLLLSAFLYPNDPPSL